ncbi:RDD family protein [Actinoallomurus purpureus]|uniref:RDD family protein n=1 Tax=Actinoallomurus purpureus TaxID=478114 RepID=UPI0020926EB5|nr:RDD family protein [Actinoallomurus purpureus]MCO6004329.1 RDD family protein [Actinoallomurus purpureus]
MTEEAVDAVAEPSQRLVARIIDTLIVGVPIGTGAAEFFSRETAQTVVAPIAFAVVFFIYEAVQLAAWGRTVGKRLTGLRVVSVTGDRPTVPQALIRAAIYALPPATRPVPVLNVLAAIFWLAENGLQFEGAYRQALHDRAAGTLVIDTRPRVVEEPAPADEPELVDGPGLMDGPELVDGPGLVDEPGLVDGPGLVDEPGSDQP